MKAFGHIVTTAAILTLPVMSAAASQGPGTSGGTATGLEQGIFAGVLVAATCDGLIVLRLRHR